MSEPSEFVKQSTASVMGEVFRDKFGCVDMTAMRTVGLQIREQLILLGADTYPHFGSVLGYILAYLHNDRQELDLSVLQDFLMEDRVHPSYLAQAITLCVVLGKCQEWVQDTMKEQPDHQIQQVSSALNKLERTIRVTIYGILEGQRKL